MDTANRTIRKSNGRAARSWEVEEEEEEEPRGFLLAPLYRREQRGVWRSLLGETKASSMRGHHTAIVPVQNRYLGSHWGWPTFTAFPFLHLSSTSAMRFSPASLVSGTVCACAYTRGCTPTCTCVRTLMQIESSCVSRGDLC